MGRNNIFISVAVQEARRIFVNPRIMTVGMLMIIIYNLVITELFTRADKTGLPVNAGEAFVAVGNSGVLLLFLPSVFLILISDFPNMDGNFLFTIQRAGRKRWLFGEIISSLFISVIYVFFMLISCCLMTAPKGFWGFRWSDTVTKYASMFPDETHTLMNEYLPPNLYNQMNFTYALIHTAILLILYLWLLSLIIMLFRLLGMKVAGIAGAFALVSLGVLTCTLDVKAMWAFPMANTITWLHFNPALSEPVFPMWISYVYFGALIIALLLGNFAAVKKLRING